MDTEVISITATAMSPIGNAMLRRPLVTPLHRDLHLKAWETVGEPHLFVIGRVSHASQH
jgi:hypothetical protein